MANSRRNEQAMTTAFNQRISEMGNMSTDLLTTFNWEASSRNSKGNVTEYATKTYEQYAERAARQLAATSNKNWDSLDESARNEYINKAQSNGEIVDRATFDSLNNLYNAINNEDIAGKKLEKEINDYKDDMGKFKGDKK